jgi:hypothetical protein
MRAVDPSIYNNNEEIRHGNKINKKHENDIFRMIMMMMNVIIQR